VVHAKLREIHPASAGLQVTEICIQRLFGEDQADPGGSLQKSLL
jgi:hypothetical protein